MTELSVLPMLLLVGTKVLVVGVGLVATLLVKVDTIEEIEFPMESPMFVKELIRLSGILKSAVPPVIKVAILLARIPIQPVFFSSGITAS